MENKTCTREEFDEAWEDIVELVRAKLVSHGLEPFDVDVTQYPRFTRKTAGQAVVNWAGCGSRTADEALTFAIALGDIANTVKKFKYNGYMIG